MSAHENTMNKANNFLELLQKYFWPGGLYEGIWGVGKGLQIALCQQVI